MKLIFIDILSVLFTISLIVMITYRYAQRSSFKLKRLSKKVLAYSLFFKILVSLLFSYTYQNIYKEGDTLHYHADAKQVAQYFWEAPSRFFEHGYADKKKFRDSDHIFIGNRYSFLFDDSPLGINMVRYTIPFEILGFGSFYATSLWLSFMAFIGIWKMYELIKNEFSTKNFGLEIILFIPTILFWSGGVLKDTLVLAAVCFIVYAFHSLLSFKRSIVKYLILFVLSVLVVVSLKPYVLVVLIPSLLLWFCLETIRSLKNSLTKLILSPIVLLLGFVFILGSMVFIQNDLGVYGDYFNLMDYGKKVKLGFDQTIIHQSNSTFYNYNEGGQLMGSTLAVLYRPFIWESWSAFSLLSAIENTILLCFSLVTLIAVLFELKSLKLLFDKPFLLFCLIFSLSFATGLGLSVSNFGALVRFKSAFIIFFLIPQLILYCHAKESLKLKGIKKGEH